MKKADKDWCVIVSDHSDYVLETEKQLTTKQFIEMLHFTKTLYQTLQKRVIKSSRT